MGLPISEIATVSIAKRTKTLSDNVSQNCGYLDYLVRKGKKDKLDGGEMIFQELLYAENSTFQYYSCLLYTSPSPRDS